MTTSLLQPSFAAGEIGPEIAARTDLARYQTGLAKCINFIINPYGGAMNRPGTVFLAETKNNEVARLIRFKFSVNDTYALEFTHLRMRVYRNGALVLNTGGPNIGLPFELVTAYTRDQLFELNYVQSADVMDIVHPSHKPKKLRRFGHDNWTISDASLVPSIAAPAGLAGVATSPGTALTLRYVVTGVIDSEAPEESLQSNTAQVTAATFDSSNPISLTWGAVGAADYYNVYKDQNQSGIFGFIGRANSNSFVDTNLTPVKTDTPPTGLDPFIGAGNFPRAVGYFQQRLVYAGTDNRPQTLWFSRTAAFQNFGYSFPNKDDDAITWTIASTEVNQIKHLTPLRSLLTFTDGAEWIIQGQSAGFTSKTINGDAQTYNGIGQLRPLVLNSTAIYAQERGRTVTAFDYSLSSDGFTGSDISILAPQMLQEYSLLDWDYQKIPYSVVWGARDDGAMIGITYLSEQQVIAWHRHYTDGKVLSVCSVPEGREDSVYLCVERTIGGVTKHYVERMASRQPRRLDGVALVQYSYFVDCGLTYDGINTSPVTMTLSGGVNWQYPESLTLTSSNITQFSAGDVGDHVQYYADLAESPFALEITGFSSGAQVTVRPLGEVPLAIRGAPFTTWAMARDNMSGLGHLEGREVVMLADGNVVRGRTVTGGSVSLDTPAGIVHIGLPYESELQTLEVNIPKSETISDKTKLIKSVTAILLESRGGFYGRSNADSELWEFKQRNDADDYGAMHALTGKAVTTITDSWQGNGQLTVVQRDPLPLNILGLVPRIDVGGPL